MSQYHLCRCRSSDIVQHYATDVMAKTHLRVARVHRVSPWLRSGPGLFLEGLTPVPAELSQCLTSNCFQLSRHRRLSPGTCTTSLLPQEEADNSSTARGSLGTVTSGVENITFAPFLMIKKHNKEVFNFIFNTKIQKTFSPWCFGGISASRSL